MLSGHQVMRLRWLVSGHQVLRRIAGWLVTCWLLSGSAFAPFHHPFVELWTALFAVVPFSLRLTSCVALEKRTIQMFQAVLPEI